MRVFRIERERYLADTLRGLGASMSSGFRWNSLYTPMVYTSGSRSLALLEICVHLNLHDELPTDRQLVEIDIPNTLRIDFCDSKDMPKGWDSVPPDTISQRLGDEFIRKGKTAVLRVPSCIVPMEYNYLINPHHPDAQKISVVGSRPFQIDHRIRV